MEQKQYTLLTPIVVKLGEEFASVQNPTLNYLEFVFTDDKPNANSKGIPEIAFSSIINTGVLMPVKMADGEISRGHEGTIPIGVISAMDRRQVEDRKQVVGKAALWSKEHPENINLLKESYAAGDPLNMSWELLYTESEIDDSGIEWLKDPIVRAITVVGAPAYGGRTPIESVAAEEEAAVWTTEYKNNLPDSAFLYVEPGGKKDSEGKTVPRSLRHFPYKNAEGQIDRAHLTNAVQRIPQSDLPADVKTRVQARARKLLENLDKQGNSAMDELETLKAQLAELETQKAELETQLAAKVAELETANTELASLKEFKAEADRLAAESQLLETRVGTLADNGIKYTDEEIAAKREMLLKLDETAFNYLVAELKDAIKEATSEESEKTQIPGSVSSTTGAKAPFEVVREGFKNLKLR